jgi:hypothetical protein
MAGGGREHFATPTLGFVEATRGTEPPGTSEAGDERRRTSRHVGDSHGGCRLPEPGNSRAASVPQ